MEKSIYKKDSGLNIVMLAVAVTNFILASFVPNLVRQPFQILLSMLLNLTIIWDIVDCALLVTNVNGTYVKVSKILRFVTGGLQFVYVLVACIMWLVTMQKANVIDSSDIDWIVLTIICLWFFAIQLFLKIYIGVKTKKEPKQTVLQS